MNLGPVGPRDLARIAADPDYAHTCLDESSRHADLEKGWDLLGRFLADGDPSGLLGWGEPVGDPDADIGYGPPVAIQGDGLARLRAALAGHPSGAIAAYVAGIEASDSPYPYHHGVPEDLRAEAEDWLEDLRATLEDILAGMAADEALLLVMY